MSSDSSLSCGEGIPSRDTKTPSSGAHMLGDRGAAGESATDVEEERKVETS